MSLLDYRGNPLAASSKFAKENIASPKVGVALGQWAGRENFYQYLPGGGVMQFDLSKLTLADYRSMRQHYQLGASLNVLSFVMHQIDWDIECENAEIRDMIHQDLEDNWTPFIRSISQAFWAGYSPIAVNYKNHDGYVRIDKFKDIVPEEARIKWNKVDGWAPAGKPKPRIYEYDGFYQDNSWIPPENTLWYPLLMENGDHYGRKLLKPAFPSWYFSNLIHLFANRYFERFGEPLPVGRARFDDDVDMGGGNYVTGKKAMETAISAIRSRAVVVLPSDRDPVTKEYDYDIEYLESQMRGADFERYLSRLDEEMSLSVFTPILLFRTADVGSYNLGQAHLRVFQQMLNAIAGDLQYYIQNYLVERLRVVNFGPNAPEVRWTYRKQGQGDIDTYKLLMSEVVRTGRAEPDYEQLGAIVGLPFNKIEEIVEPPAEPINPDQNTNPDVQASRSVAQEAASRAAREYSKGNSMVTLGYRNRFRDALVEGGFSPDVANTVTGQVYGRINAWLPDAITAEPSADELRGMICRLVDSELERV